MAFESTKGPGDLWNPTKDAEGDPRQVTKDDYLDGYYVDRKDGIGEHNSIIYTIQKADGSRVGVWGTKVLNDEMEKQRRGSFIRIQWLGKKLTKAGAIKPEKKRQSTDSFHDWEVFVDNSVKALDVHVSEGEKAFSPADKPAKLSTSQNGATSSERPTVEAEDDLPF